MKSNYLEHLAWYEHSVRPNAVTPGDSNTRCWHATMRKEASPSNPTSDDSSIGCSTDASSVETSQSKRRRLDSEEKEEEEEEKMAVTFTSVAVQTSPLLRGIERTHSMETIYFDASDDLSLDENQDENNSNNNNNNNKENQDALLDRAIHQKLNSVFKSDKFISNQYEAIYSTLKKEHVLLVLPSGPCRDLCYLLPSTMTEIHTKRMRNAKTFVLFPSRKQLPDKDQYTNIPKRIIVSNSTEKQEEEPPWIPMDQLYEDLCEHDIKLVYMTVKDFAWHKTMMQELYKQNLISRLVIEDAHCLSARSQGVFKASYRHLVTDIRASYPDLPVMALTSIPFSTVHSDIIDALSIHNCKLYKNSLFL